MSISTVSQRARNRDIRLLSSLAPCSMPRPMPMAMAKHQVVSRGSVSSCPGVWVSSSQREKPKEVEEDFPPRGVFVQQRVVFFGWGGEPRPRQIKKVTDEKRTKKKHSEPHISQKEMIFIAC